MKNIDKIKYTFVTVFTAINGFLGSLAIPFYILVMTNMGFHGIVKKVCMWMLVLAGYIVDYIVVSMGHTMHIEFGFSCLVAAAVVFWLLANELISILENIADIGVPMPAFLLKAVELVKEKTEYSVQKDKEV